MWANHERAPSQGSDNGIQFSAGGAGAPVANRGIHVEFPTLDHIPKIASFSKKEQRRKSRDGQHPIVKKVLLVEFGGSQIKVIKWKMNMLKADLKGQMWFSRDLVKIVGVDQIPWFEQNSEGENVLSAEEIEAKILAEIESSVVPAEHPMVMIFVSGGHVTRCDKSVDINHDQPKRDYCLGDSVLAQLLKRMLLKIYNGDGGMSGVLPVHGSKAFEFLLVAEPVYECVSVYSRFMASKRKFRKQSIYPGMPKAVEFAKTMVSTLMIFGGSTSCQVAYMKDPEKFEELDCVSYALAEAFKEKGGEAYVGKVLDSLLDGRTPSNIILGSNYAFQIVFHAFNCGSKPHDMPNENHHIFLESYFKGTDRKRKGLPGQLTPFPGDHEDETRMGLMKYKPDQTNIVTLEMIKKVGPFHNPDRENPHRFTNGKVEPNTQALLDSLEFTLDYLTGKGMNPNCFVFKQLMIDGSVAKAGAGHGAVLMGLRALDKMSVAVDLSRKNKTSGSGCFSSCRSRSPEVL